MPEIHPQRLVRRNSQQVLSEVCEARVASVLVRLENRDQSAHADGKVRASWLPRTGVRKVGKHKRTNLYSWS